MKNRYYSQIDERWCREMIGKSNLSVYSWGCLLTTVCNAIQKIYKHFDFTPKHGAELFEYTSTGKLIHKSIAFKGMEARRVYGRPSHTIISDFTNHDEKAIGVRMAYNPKHWLLVHKWTVRWLPFFLAADPYTYNPHTKTCRIVRKLKRNIDGAFLFSNGN